MLRLRQRYCDGSLGRRRQRICYIYGCRRCWLSEDSYRSRHGRRWQFDLIVSGIELLTILMGVGDGTFIEVSTYRVDGVFSATVGDVNEDGHLDIVASGDIGLVRFPGGLFILLGQGNGSFGTATKYGSMNGIGVSPGPTTSKVRVADLNADGHMDIVTFNDDDGIAVRLGDGTGSFLQRIDYATNVAPWGAYFGIDVTDVNGDTIPDIVTTNDNARLAVLLGSGSGAFEGTVVRYGALTGVIATAVADIDRDGHADVVSLNEAVNGSSTVSIYYGDGAGHLGRRFDHSIDDVAAQLALGDVDEDGDIDILTGGMQVHSRFDEREWGRLHPAVGPRKIRGKWERHVTPCC